MKCIKSIKSIKGIKSTKSITTSNCTLNAKKTWAVLSPYFCRSIYPYYDSTSTISTNLLGWQNSNRAQLHSRESVFEIHWQAGTHTSDTALGLTERKTDNLTGALNKEYTIFPYVSAVQISSILQNNTNRQMVQCMLVVTWFKP